MSAGATRAEPVRIETDVLVIGSGAAGMYAAIEAARAGCRVLLIDRSLIGRGGATVMAQMTVAVALGAEAPDHWSHHYQDTLDRRPRALQRAAVAAALRGRPGLHPRRWTPGASAGRARTARSPRRSRRAMTGRAASMSISSTPARRCRRRCAPSCTRHQASAAPAISASSISLKVDGEVAGAVAWHVGSGAPVVIAAKATIVATGGLTRLYRRNSASTNMGGDGYALASARRRAADRHGVRAVLPDRPSGAAADRHGPDHVGPVPLQARRPAAQQATCRSSPTATACRRTANTSSPAMSAPTPSSRRSRPAAARRTAAPI